MKRLNPNAVPNLLFPPLLAELSQMEDSTTTSVSTVSSSFIQYLPNSPLKVQAQQLDITFVTQPVNLKNTKINKHFKRCKKYINKIYRLKKMLKKGKNSAASRKSLLDSLKE
ncbi:uncharacterized protein LOC120636822 [Pararge aegeria]|uniref:Jg22007 protein n=1 Tax=Pararge aegeria aegeria TaxID=348720 RepID=A0A8S4R0L7_9NEOP|nr:uncharacterized protein LOC120636822 [Pararge aegeria]XP_039764321.1 uncharacterized protein LOC120636822 [Pararge aegeria]CAH2228605.1 jg22007 [Pararge aegeria aegeria]